MFFAKPITAYQPSNLLFSSILLTILLLLPTSTNSISFRFPRFEIDNINMVYEGDAAQCDGAIRLNRNDFLCRVGRATYFENVRIWDPSTHQLADFTTRFSFAIDTLRSPSYGHGLAFFLASSDTQIPPNSAGGFLGLFNTTTLEYPTNTQILGVEFDSFPNNDWDPPVEHVGIILNSLSSPAFVPWNAGFHSSDVGNAWIGYNASTKMLHVGLTYDHSPGNYNVTYNIDLREILPEWVKIGFSAATGKNTESHLLHSWEFNSTLEGTRPNSRLDQTQTIPTVDSTGSSNQNPKIKWLVGGFIFVGALLITALILIFWLAWRSDSNGTAGETGETTSHTRTTNYL
ncbi:hypothetical protein ACLOJK_036184 [Asimina triloba]